MSHSRHTRSFNFEEEITLEKIVSWCSRFKPFVILNSNSNQNLPQDFYHSYDILIGAGEIDLMRNSEKIFDSLNDFQNKNNDWLFGYLSYDVKNQVENLRSENHDGIEGDVNYFFQPRYVFQLSEKNLIVHYLPEFDNEQSIDHLISDFKKHIPDIKSVPFNPLDIRQRVNKEDYMVSVDRIKKHIKRGDIYELNYCIEFYGENATINPLVTYLELNNLSPMPFSTFCRFDDLYILCASPERFLAKRSSKIISQPIKGTIRRGKNENEDDQLIESLKNNPKEQSENVMIVDLVRNDLSRTAAKGSVKVEELFGIKTFKQLHQMVSTVTSEVSDDVCLTDVIKYAFPMGSMTGAPKIKAMELIEEYEKTKRGIYSGAIGYVNPNSDFDFNVVIRSILYNSKNHYLSFMAGSAITDRSEPEKEYQECLLKAGAMKKILGQSELISEEQK